MKKIFEWMLGAMMITMTIVMIPAKKVMAQPGVSVSFQTFYDDLSPYGNWIYDNDYGYVWSPQVGNDFRPYYSNGQWAMTDYGNTWVSGYDWGWAPFHYGRWTQNRFYGWVWVPGNTWGPAWVNWRSGGGNYGWAPLGPGININVSFGSGYYTPYDWWTFVPCGNLYNGYYNNYWRGSRYNNTYINNTVIVNNTYNNTYVYGPRRNEVEQVTGGRVNVYNLRNQRTAGRTAIAGNSVNIYRPSVRNNNRVSAEAPRKFVRADNDRSIKNAAPALTGRIAAERNQRELSTNPARNASVTTRNNDRNSTITPNTREVERDNGNNRAVRNANTTRQNTGTVSEQRAQQQRAQEIQARDQRVQQERVQRDQQRVQETQVREQRAQQQRAQEIQASSQRAQQQERVQRDQQRAQETQVREQRVQQERVQQQRAQEMQTQRAQQERVQRDQQRAQQVNQQRQVQQAPQREWRRPEPQRVERAQPVQRGGGESVRGGRR